MARRRTADKPWQLIIWILGTGFLFFSNIYMLFTEGFDLTGVFLTAVAGYALISSIVALRESLKR